MAKIRSHLSRAPVAEALIDFQVEPQPSQNVQALRSLANAFDGFQLAGPIFTMQTTWSIGEDGPMDKSERSEIGFRLHSSDERRVLQVRTNGFTYSRLEPYETWETLVSETRNAWDIYHRALRPSNVVRVATRYINQLKLPIQAQQQHFEDFLTAAPRVPAELPQTSQEFVQRVVIVNQAIDARAIVTQLLMPVPTPPDFVPVVLDIDVFKQVKIRPDSVELWKLLADLRIFKNEVFYASLTERAVELYE